MSWRLGDDDPAQDARAGETDTARREAWNAVLQLLAVLAIYGFMALTLGDTYDREYEAQQQRQAPLVERWRQFTGAAPGAR